MPSSAASARVEGSGVSGRIAPRRTPSRRALSSWRESGSRALRSSSTSISGARLVRVEWSTKSALKWTLTPGREGSSFNAVKLRILLPGSLAALVVASAAAATGTPQVVARIPTGSRPCSEAGGFGALWVGNNGSGTLARIDPKRNKVTKTVRVGAGPCGVAIGAGSVWVDGYSSASVVRVNPRRMKVVKRIHLPDLIWDVTFGARSVWATETTLGYVDRIDPKKNRVRKRIKLPRGSRPANLRYGAGAVWVGQQSGNRIFRIDVRTNRVTSVRVGNGPRSLAVSPTAVWVSNSADNTVSRIDPATRTVVATIPVGQLPENAAIAGDGTVFVPSVNDGTVSRIDPATNQVIGTIPVGQRPFPAAFAFGDVWVPSYGGRDVYRIHVG